MLVSRLSDPIRLEISSSFKRYDSRRRAEELLHRIAKRCDSNKVEEISYQKHIYEPASYNDYKKTSSEIIIASLRIPKEFEQPGENKWNKDPFKMVLVSMDLGLAGIQEEAKGFNFKGVNFHQYGERVSITIEFQKERRA